jgi:GNAT superfamily N-acetyltransferase
MIFAVEPLGEAWGEMITLASQHWHETQEYRHNQPFAPSFDRYNQYAQSGWFLQFTVRDEGRMVGYGGVYLVPSMHTQVLIAQEDTWYLLPAYRKGWTAMKFFKFMEAECRKRGARQVNLTVPEGIGTGVLCERMGYRKVAIHYAKDIHPLEGAAAVTDMQCSNSQVRADSPPLQRVELSNVPSNASGGSE